MATVSITIPDSQMDDVAAAALASMPDAKQATPAASVAAVLRAYLEALYAQHMQRTAATDDPTAIAALEAEAAAVQARKDAQAARDAAQATAREQAKADASLWT